MGTRLRGRGQGWSQPPGPAVRSQPVAQAFWLPRGFHAWGCQEHGTNPTGLGWTVPELLATAPGELWVLLGLWPWGTVWPWGLGAPQRWHLGSGTFCYHRGPAGSPGMRQGSLAPVTFPFPSPASAKRVCYIFNILRALLVGI